MTGLLFSLLASGLVAASPGPGVPGSEVGEPRSGEGWSEPLAVSGTVGGARATTRVLVYLPRGYAARAPGRRFPLVIALHGWNHAPELYRDKGDLGAFADRYGVVVAVPAMGKTVYETRFYPESSKRWGAVPGTPFVAEVLLPTLRARYAVAEDRAHTAVIGYSTGGRGAVLLAEAYPLFAFAGSLSGTFDLTRLDPGDGEYKIHALVYGPRRRFAERWERDNVVAAERLAGLRGVAVFAAHGADDAVVHPDQLYALRDALGAGAHATFTVAAGQGHTWAFWNSQSEALFAALGRALGLAPTVP
ncbi:MAG: hypothetical protein CVU56_16170 [Deltaproteobacteria bacterium HGW-Deltaproteobacteria-14]|jgi:S-formylglutathione hydrolase FrmB|nr:MAG: hypothetical protein CVU56_16170 [Deltaproteobacteria bacterium HGW-Deltaproteobacteria-14]